MKKKKLLLINPGGKDFRHNKFYEPIELGIVASLVTAPNWEVKIVDLRFEDTDLPEADIVALSSRIIDINTTYEIIRHYKTKGIKTVIGGTHATLCPDEAQKYADVVVIGEAEGVLMQILKDFENGTLKKIYKGCTDLKYTVNRNYYKHYYKTATLQLSRGCPLACDFCCVGKIHNRTHRYRDFKDVVSEIKKTKQKLLFFTDENMYGFSSKNRETVLSFFNEMITQKVNKHWIGMASINAGIDDEFLSLARKSGCIMLLIGFEAIEEDTLTSINKKLNAKLIHDYDRIIKNIHKHRIAVCGAFMLGLPTDNERVIKKRKEFIVKSKIDVYFVTMFTPFPGSKLFDDLQQENKIIYNNYPQDWDYYNQNMPVCTNDHINNMRDLFLKCQNDIRQPKILRKRFLMTLFETRSLSCALYSNYYNFNHFRAFDRVKSLRIINNLFERYQKWIYKKSKV